MQKVLDNPALFWFTLRMTTPVLSTTQWLDLNCALVRSRSGGALAVHVGAFVAGFFGLSDEVGDALGETAVEALPRARAWVDDARAESHAWNTGAVDPQLRATLDRNLANLQN